MSSLNPQIATATLAAQLRRRRHLDAGLKSCRSALSRGNTLAVQGEFEAASREVWLVEDTTVVILTTLGKMNDPQGLARCRKELAQIQRDLNDLKTYLGIPPGVN